MLDGVIVRERHLTDWQPTGDRLADVGHLVGVWNKARFHLCLESDLGVGKLLSRGLDRVRIVGTR
jgi:hypothetical protein